MRIGTHIGYRSRKLDAPAGLFTGGVQGAWYDPSDASTLFSDTAGTTPSPTPGGGALSVVGLMLDKSQGLALGSELITNGDFSSATGWVLSAGASISSGVLTFSSVASTLGATQANYSTLATNDTAKVVIVVTALTAGQFRVKLNGGSFVLVPASVGTHTLYVVAGSAPAGGLELVAAGTTSGTVDSISVQKLPGNHAISYNTTTARPELSARVNLLTYSEQFDNAAWTRLNVTVSPNNGLAPDGTTTADLVYPSTTGVSRTIYQAGPGTTTSSVTSFYAKASGKSWIWVVGAVGSSTSGVYFNVSTGTKGFEFPGYTGTITPVGNGWYRLVVQNPSTAMNFGQITIVDADNTNSVTANGTDGILVWGADLRPANIGTSVPSYQRIADQYTYDSSGFPRYLKFDGIDDGMYTPANLNLSGTDKATVFAGVRKISDATYPTITELSASAALNLGSFAIYTGGNTNAPQYPVYLLGTTTTGYEPGTYTAPISNVLTVSFDIGGAARANEIVPRINGVLNQTNPVGTANAGTGNFGTYPLYIGARNNTSNWLNGYIYSLIVVGAASTAAQISSTESWINVKEGGVY